MRFRTTLPHSPPDAELYQELKGVTPIEGELIGELPPTRSYRVPVPILRMVGRHMTTLWTRYSFGRLAVAAGLEALTSLPAPFPGRLLPRARGFDPVDRGYRQIDWARHALEMDQPTRPATQAARRLNGSGLEILSFSEDDRRRGRWEPDRLSAEAAELLRPPIRMEAALTWVDALWSPHEALPPLRPELTFFAHELWRAFGAEVRDPLALLLEIHDIVRRLEAHAALGIERIGMGEFGGVWCEVGLIQLAAIKATELVQTRRAVQELRTLYTRGFAPLVVNEWGCNTDGSHRQVATWLWNALSAAKACRSLSPLEAVPRFICHQRSKMGTLLAHEVERVFREAWADEECRPMIEEALTKTRFDRRIERLPIVLVPEWSAATVIKGPYDDRDHAIRVCPSVYGLMAREQHIVLPARGPYHRTDALLLPWFRVTPD